MSRRLATPDFAIATASKDQCLTFARESPPPPPPEHALLRLAWFDLRFPLFGGMVCYWGSPGWYQLLFDAQEARDGGRVKRQPLTRRRRRDRACTVDLGMQSSFVGTEAGAFFGGGGGVDTNSGFFFL